MTLDGIARRTKLIGVSSSSFQDHFSGVSSSYATYRPRYPEALFDWLHSIAPGAHLAWDCGTGSGQAAVPLVGRFEHVVASDAAAAQIAEAQRADGVQYAVFPAERAALADSSVDLVTVAQALHWFDHECFYAEVRRVLAPGGVLAAWNYQLFCVEPRFDAIVNAWYRGAIDAYWPAERRHIESGYRTIPFPFGPVESPTFEMEASWTLPEVLGYLGTWSAVKRYRDAHREDPITLIREELADAWGDPQTARRVVWSMSMLAGR